jgi:hypothetical protein
MTAADLQRLGEAFEELNHTPFPSLSGDDELDDLISAVGMYESHIAGIVGTFLEKWRVTFDPAESAGLRARLEGIAQAQDQARAAKASEYLVYLEKIENVVALLEVARHG